MRKIAWKLRYAIHAWGRGIPWRAAWHCAGASVDDDSLDPWQQRDPLEEADVEISYWREG